LIEVYITKAVLRLKKSFFDHSIVKIKKPTLKKVGLKTVN